VALIELLQATLARGASFRFRTSSFSMDPFIRDGDVITVSALSEGSPGLGDVVAFVQKETPKRAVHRLVRMKGSSYLIKGDNTTGADGLIPRANILRSVKRVERKDKRVFLDLGPERFLIALLTRMGLTIPLVRVAVKLLRPFRNIVMVL